MEETPKVRGMEEWCVDRGSRCIDDVAPPRCCGVVWMVGKEEDLEGEGGTICTRECPR